MSEGHSRCASGPANEIGASLDEIAKAVGPDAIRNAPLGARTTYRVGGEAAVLLEVGDENVLKACHDALAAVDRPIPVLVIGRGSNMLVADAGFPGLAIVLTGEFEAVEIDQPTATVRAGGAVGLQALARETAGAGLTGFEWAVGIPGSIGGAVRMNAGGHGSEMADVLRRARIFDLVSGSATLRELAELDTGYRRSAIGAADVVVRAELALGASDPEVALGRVRDVVRWRVANQPGGLNAGSVFTNPPGDSAGRLIDSAGLKGLRVGTASVSEKHANFFQADKQGSADDVKALIDRVRALVAEKEGVDLVPELVMVGFSDTPLPRIHASSSTRGSDLHGPSSHEAPAQGAPSTAASTSSKGREFGDST